ncbi:MAG: hypothetical protein ACKO9Y_09620 [Sphaerospermopsis kisseleviana]
MIFPPFRCTELFQKSNISPIDAQFNNAILTGICINNWQINHQTIFDNVICNYIYLDENKTERRPIKGNFEAGVFANLCQEIIENKNKIVSRILENNDKIR